MDTIKIVLLFNEDDERQRAVGEFLKTQKRCKTAFITELVYGWMDKRDGKKMDDAITGEREMLEKVKTALLSDTTFVNQLSSLLSDSMGGFPIKNERENPDTESDVETVGKDETSLDMDEDMMLAGLSLFESQDGF